ncbi:MAG TPA: ATPase, T2SS/T4P/T4SS family [Vicinamibacterales bacterium]|nr:ATPase, T2SS/T4P/T4SS family [Vicinamibacterales bacterium]
MSLLESLLDAIVRLQGDALVMHVGEKPYVVTTSASANEFRGPLAWGQVELSSRVLTPDAVLGMLGQILPLDQRQALENFGAIEYEIAPPAGLSERFTVVAARGGDDIWLEVRRHPAVAEPAAAANVEPEAAPVAEEMPAPVAAAAPQEQPALAAAIETPAQARPVEHVGSQPVEAVSAGAAPDDDDAFEIVHEDSQAAPTDAEVDELFAASAAVLRAAADGGTNDDNDLSFAIDDDFQPAVFEEVDEVLSLEPPVVMSEPVAREPERVAESEPEQVVAISAETVFPAPPVAAFEESVPEVAVAPVPDAVVEEAPPIVPVPEPVAAVSDAVVEEPCHTEIAAEAAAEPVEVIPEVAAPIVSIVPEPVEMEPEPTVSTVADEPEHTEVATEFEAESVEVVLEIAPPAPVVASAPDPVVEKAPEVVVAGSDRLHQTTESVEASAKTGEPVEAPTIKREEQRPAVVVTMARRGGAQEPTAAARRSPSVSVEEILRTAVARGAATVYIVAGTAPMLRTDGEIAGLDTDRLSPSDVERLMSEVAPAEPDDVEGGEWIRDVADVGRVRCLAFRDHRGPGLILRLIPPQAISADQLGLTAEVQALCGQSDGLVLVTGPRASGKSTLMSAFVDLINRTRSDHVITVESQIGFLHESRRSFVSQREVRGNADAVADAVRAALREDPDVLLIEDLRSADIAAAALEAAESGRLVFGSLSAPSTIAGIDELIELFPADRRAHVQGSLAAALRGVVAQVLVRRVRGGRTAAREVLLNTPAVAALIKDGKTFDLPRAMASGRHGMAPLNDSLVRLVRDGTVHVTEAYRKAFDKEALLAALERDSVDTSFAERLA